MNAAYDSYCIFEAECNVMSILLKNRLTITTFKSSTAKKVTKRHFNIVWDMMVQIYFSFFLSRSVP